MKKAPLKKKTKDPRTVLLRKIDRLLQDSYRFNFKGTKCESCQDSPFDLVHHFIEKSRSANLRFDPDNLIFLCQKCHVLHHNYGDATISARIILRRGEGWLRSLLKKAIFKRWSLGELREMESKFK